MYPDWSVIAMLALAAVFIWLGVLTFLLWQQDKFLKSLFPRSGSRDIRKKFEEITNKVEGFSDKVIDLDDRVGKVRSQGLTHIQKVELLRFNPYDDTGGDQSFVVCLLDDQGTGVVITSLHARSGTRLFGKEIISGKSAKHQLSKEEELVIKKAVER
ncbi:DUF4446 family protein [Candidatus Daviesbacteria bacterium]|nr:DUF4446 family protein [Candidatus Daviesbacteria bacterium]